MEIELEDVGESFRENGLPFRSLSDFMVAEGVSPVSEDARAIYSTALDRLVVFPEKIEDKPEEFYLALNLANMLQIDSVGQAPREEFESALKYVDEGFSAWREVNGEDRPALTGSDILKAYAFQEHEDEVRETFENNDFYDVYSLEEELWQSEELEPLFERRKASDFLDETSQAYRVFVGTVLSDLTCFKEYREIGESLAENKSNGRHVEQEYLDLMNSYHDLKDSGKTEEEAIQQVLEGSCLQFDRQTL